MSLQLRRPTPHSFLPPATDAQQRRGREAAGNRSSSQPPYDRHSEELPPRPDCHRSADRPRDAAGTAERATGRRSLTAASCRQLPRRTEATDDGGLRGEPSPTAARRLAGLPPTSTDAKLSRRTSRCPKSRSHQLSEEPPPAESLILASSGLTNRASAASVKAGATGASGEAALQPT